MLKNVIETAKILQWMWKIEEYKEIIALVDDLVLAKSKNHEFMENEIILKVEIKELKEELKFKWKVTFKDNMCYKEWDENLYCSSCYGGKNKFIHLHIWEYSNVCPICKVSVSTWKRMKSIGRPNMSRFM